MKESVLREKSYSFALRIVKLYKHIVAKENEYVLSKQILRSGTSIGANIEEANQAQSKKDFIHILSIAQKESFETDYWLRLLSDSEYLTAVQADSVLRDCRELEKLLTSSVKTAKNNLANAN